MPWDCKSCESTVENDDVVECPGCGAKKAAWTMVADKTRTFSMTSRKKVHYLKGEEAEPLEGEASDYEPVVSVEIEEAVSVEKQVALHLAEDGVLPPPDQLLVARILVTKPGDIEVVLSPEYETREVEELTFTETAPPEKEGETMDVCFLLVHGPETLPDDFELPGVHVVDISEDTDAGHAPQIGIRAVTRRRKVLPIVKGLKAFVWSV